MPKAFRDGNAPSGSSSDENSSSGWESLDLDKLSPDDVVDIDLSEEPAKAPKEPEPVVEVEDEVLEAVAPVVPDADAASEPVPGTRAEKRIKGLLDKTNNLSVENQQLRHQLYLAQNKQSETLANEVSYRKTAASEKIESLKREYAQAEMDADPVKKADLIDKMSKANVELMSLEAYTPTPRPVTAPQTERNNPQQQGSMPSRASVIEKLPDAGKRWASKNPWFMINPKLTQEALGVAAEVEAEGYAPEEDEYFERVHEKMADLYPARFGKKEPVAARPAAVIEDTPPPVAPKKQPPQSPVGNSRPVPTQKPGTVRLSREEVDRAKKWGIPLSEMARQKQSLEKSEKDGDKYSPIF